MATAAIVPVVPLVNDLVKGLDARRNVRVWFFRMGLMSEGLAKERAPVRTGFLRSTINWALVGTDISAGGVLQGRLQVAAVYGRRQEWEHRVHSFYAWTAMQDTADAISGVLSSDDGAAQVWLGTGRGWKGTWSWNPGITTFSRGSPGGVVSGSAGSIRVR